MYVHSSGGRKALVVGAHAPSKSGLQAGQKFSWYIYDYLARSGYEVGFLGLVPKWECERVTLDERKVFCRWGVVPVTWGTRIRGVATAGELPLAFGVRHSKTFRDRLVGELKLWDPGVVILDHAAMLPYTRWVPARCVVGVVEHDVLFQAWERMAQRACLTPFDKVVRSEVNRLRRWEVQLLKRMDFIVVPSQKDAALLREYLPGVEIVEVSPFLEGVYGRVCQSVGVREKGSVVFWGGDE